MLPTSKLLLAAAMIGGCQGFQTLVAPQRLQRTATSSTALLCIMGARRKGDVTRREVLDGNSAYKQFVGAGGGEGLLFVIAASIATFGGQKRSAMFDRFAAMDDG